MILDITRLVLESEGYFLMSGHVHSAAEQPFLPKPFGPAVLKQRVRQTLSTNRPERRSWNAGV